MAEKPSWLRSMFSNETSEGDAISASPMNSTKIVALLGLLTTIITQSLENVGTIKLDNWQIIVIWIAAGTLIVTLVVADMLCRAWVTTVKMAVTGPEAKTKATVSADGRSAQDGQEQLAVGETQQVIVLRLEQP